MRKKGGSNASGFLLDLVAYDRAPQVFAYEESGQVVGELAVLFRAPRAATVKAHF